MKAQRIVAAGVAGMLASAGSAVVSTAGAGAQESKPPVKIVMIGGLNDPVVGTDLPQLLKGPQAAAKRINKKEGGINDQRVVVTGCNAVTPNETTNCAREAAADENVVAVIGLFSPPNDGIFPVLEENQLAAFGTAVAGRQAGSSPVSFPFESAFPNLLAGMVDALKAAGATKIATLFPGGAPDTAVVDIFAKPAAQAAGIEHVRTVPIPIPPPADFSTYVAAAAADGVDGIFAFYPGPTQGTLIAAIRQGAPEAEIAAMAQFVDKETVETLDDAAEGLVLLDYNIPLSSKKVEGVKQFHKDMDALGTKVARTPGALTNWLAVDALARMMEGKGTVTRASVFAAAGQLNDFDLLGVHPNITTASPGTTAGGPRVFNPTISATVIKNGKQVLQRKSEPFTNPFEEG